MRQLSFLDVLTKQLAKGIDLVKISEFLKWFQSFKTDN